MKSPSFSHSKYTKYFLYSCVVFLVVVCSFSLNVFFSFEPSRIDPVPEVTANALMPPDRQVPFRHFPVMLDDIPISCKQATIATEDHNFYNHIGIDASGMIRGIFGQLTGIDAGGSTLDQQLVKNISGQIYNRSLVQKLVETIEALKLDLTLSKSQILEMYLNSVYYGNYNFGIEAASEQYFGKTVKALSIAECTYLAGLPQQPSIYNPFANQEAGLERQKVVVKAMNRDGYINTMEMDQILNTKLQFASVK